MSTALAEHSQQATQSFRLHEKLRAGGVCQRIHQKLAGVKLAEPVDMTGKTVVVTGCAPNSLGEATAAVLAEQGAHVVVTRRRGTTEAIDRLCQLSLSMEVSGYDLDVQSRGSVQRFADWMQTKFPEGIDVLINNAGVHLDLMRKWKQPQLVGEEEIHWRTNFLGSVDVTHAMLPFLLRRARVTKDARVVNVASMFHHKGSNQHVLSPHDFYMLHYDSWAAYGNSKLAMMHYAQALQKRFSSEGLQAYSLHPGAVYTNVADKGLDGHAFLQGVRKVFAPVESFFLQSPLEGAQTSVYCATEPSLQGGRYFQACAPKAASLELDDQSVSDALWVQTQHWIQQARA